MDHRMPPPRQKYMASLLFRILSTKEMFPDFFLSTPCIGMRRWKSSISAAGRA